MVGEIGFEPTTCAPQTHRAAKLRHSPLFGAEGGTRTRMDNCPTDFKSVVYTNSTTSAWSSRVESNHLPMLYKNTALTNELLEGVD